MSNLYANEIDLKNPTSKQLERLDEMVISEVLNLDRFPKFHPSTNITDFQIVLIGIKNLPLAETFMDDFNYHLEHMFGCSLTPFETLTIPLHYLCIAAVKSVRIDKMHDEKTEGLPKSDDTARLYRY